MIGAKKFACLGMKKSKTSTAGIANRTPGAKGGSGNAVQRASVNNPPKGKDALPRKNTSGGTYRTVER